MVGNVGNAIATLSLATSELGKTSKLGKSCVLVTGGEDKSQYTCKDIEENSEELAALLAQGYTVSSIELIWQERVQFVLTNNFLLKRLKCLDYLEDAFKDNGKLDDDQEQFDANFSLLIGELRDLISFLMDKCRKKETVVVPEEACVII